MKTEAETVVAVGPLLGVLDGEPIVVRADDVFPSDHPIPLAFPTKFRPAVDPGEDR